MKVSRFYIKITCRTAIFNRILKAECFGKFHEISEQKKFKSKFARILSLFHMRSSDHWYMKLTTTPKLNSEKIECGHAGPSF
jgi:hypothetical protein